MSRIRNKRGMVLIFSFIAIVILTVLGIAVLSRNLGESRASRRTLEETQAFWLAEAGVNRALNELRDNYSLTEIGATPLGPGGYRVEITPSSSTERTVTSFGFIPFNQPFRSERIIEVIMNQLPTVPANFYDKALYVAGNINISGNAYDITGDVAYGGAINDTDRIVGTVTNDAASPLPLLDFDQLRAISQAQGNYHDATQLDGPFPASFWYDQPAGIPNVIFLEGNLRIRGNISVGGFYVVGGSVIYDATLSGTPTINGAVYTRGTFTANGGGSGINIDGGVWAGQAVIHGNVDVGYNVDYMNAIKNLGIATNVQIISWRDTENPYGLTP